MPTLCLKQPSFTDAEYAGKGKQTRRERFLIEMDQVVPWQALMALIEPSLSERRAYPLGAMLRVHLMQNWFGYRANSTPSGSYSDPAENALYEVMILRHFAGCPWIGSRAKPTSSTSVACRMTRRPR